MAQLKENYKKFYLRFATDKWRWSDQAGPKYDFFASAQQKHVRGCLSSAGVMMLAELMKRWTEQHLLGAVKKEEAQLRPG